MVSLRRLACSGLLVAAIAARADAAPGAATLIAPNGVVTSTTIAFSWDAVFDSTWYQLWIGTTSPSALVHVRWYSAAQAGCAGGGGVCTITLTPSIVPGGYVWFIQTWGGADGPWSSGKGFDFRDTPSWSRKIPAHQRFTLVLDNEAVLDNETGLTWQRTPSPLITNWQTAIGTCVTSGTGGRHGWRLPTFHELSSLAVAGLSPPLPAGHPFDLGTTLHFWSETMYGSSASVLVAGFSGSVLGVYSVAPTGDSRMWCVRGPTGATR